MSDPLPAGAPGIVGAAVRFLQPEVKGARPSKLTGSGTVALHDASLQLAGRKRLPAWAAILVVACAAAASLALLGIVAWPIAIAMLLFIRVRHRESFPLAGVRSVTYEARRGRFLATADVGGRLQCVAWQTRGDPAALAGALGQQFGDSFREGPVRGWRTF
jgi:hypothetical protein